MLLTETDRAGEAVEYIVRSLGIRLSMQVPVAGIDLQLMVRQRAMLGSPEFERRLAEYFDPDSVGVVLGLLETFEAVQSEG